MKKIILFLMMTTIISCISDEEAKRITPKERFKIGDTAYLKPDSLKCTIYYFGGNHWNPCYAIRYIDKDGIVRESGTGWSNSLIKETMFH